MDSYDYYDNDAVYMTSLLVAVTGQFVSYCQAHYLYQYPAGGCATCIFNATTRRANRAMS